MMKKAIKVMVILGLLLAGFSTTTPTFAADEEPFDGPYSTILLEAFATETGETVEDILALRMSGLSYREIAIQLGYEGEELTDLFERVGETALALAVEEGIITQEESDQITVRMTIIRNIVGWFVEIFLTRLGLTREEVVAYLQSGMTLREIMEMQGIEVGQGFFNRCGVTYEEFLTRIRAGEYVDEICPGLQRPENRSERFWSDFNWSRFDWSEFERPKFNWP
jgi:hypothetical protein